jgi:ketosteroid isomerase-like protein
MAPIRDYRKLVLLEKSRLTQSKRKEMSFTAALVLLLLTTDLKVDLDLMVSTERAFAKTAMEKSIRDSFLAFIDDEGIIFRPTAVAGKKWLEDSPATASMLIWEPAFAEISKSGDLGYTTGPWENRHSISDTPRAYGQYVTMWKKQPDTTWKFVLNLEIAHDQGVPKPVRVESPLIAMETASDFVSEIEIERVRMELLRMDSEYRVANLAQDARIYRDRSSSTIGRQNYELEKLSWKGEGARVSNSADLGYTYGTAGSNNYLHIWKKQLDGSWKVVLDLLTANQ